MNKSLLIGLVATFAVFLYSSYSTLGGFKVLFDPHAGTLVMGGTFCIMFFCFPLADIKNLFLTIKNTCFKLSHDSHTEIIEQIVMLAKAKRKGEDAYNAAAKTVKQPFLKDAASVLFWTNAEISPDDFRQLLEIRALTYFEEAMTSAKMLKNTAKFPPAFGLMGTVVGLIAMLNGLSDPNAKASIGPAMAIALMATLYGVALNNLFFLPFAEHVGKLTKEALHSYNLTIEGIMLIQAKRPTKYIEEKLLSYLTLQEKESTAKKAA